MNYTPLARLIMKRRGARVDSWKGHGSAVQLAQLRWLLFRGAGTLFGHSHGFEEILKNPDPRRAFAEAVALADYEDFRPSVMRMVEGEKNILWPGACNNFAQSSGTAGGRSKYIPITRESLNINHFGGSADVVAQYLRNFPESRFFSGKGMILGGSFETQLKTSRPEVKVGDLSATLIDRIPEIGNIFRVPDKKTALLSDWHVKLDRLAEAAIRSRLTNISGVPSWFLRVIRRSLEISGAPDGHSLWPNMEVFFHGGISFEPYRHEYDNIFDPARMNYFETYNASEGFFATQASRVNDGMLLLIDKGIYYEFLPLGASADTPTLGVDEVEAGKIYELIITACNGLWRYRIGDTVEIVATDPVKIRVAGRTHSFINAFGEELMASNAERAIAAASKATGAHVHDYTAGPLYAQGNRKGRHQWLIEWARQPDDPAKFAEVLDAELKRLNSDYAAKRSGDIFLDAPEIITLPEGSFERWLTRYGSGKLGGQRKIPRLRNDREVIDSLLHDRRIY